MPKINKELPEKLRPYAFLGLDADYRPGEKDVMCDCPWCGREQKFGINTDTGQWRCFVCGTGSAKGGGNVATFLTKLWEISDQTTKDYSKLVTDRKLLSADTLSYWGAAQSCVTGDWIVPGYSVDGKIHQLYKCLTVNGKLRLLPVPTLGHQLHGVYDQRKSIVYLCEGPWDGMALWEVLGRAKPTDSIGLATTASADRSLLASACVLAVPGCNVFFESWLPLFADKIVRLMYDSDHPRKHPQTGNMTPPAGLASMQRVARILASAATPPKLIEYLRWGDLGYDPDRPSGYDVRDYLTEGKSVSERVIRLDGLLSRLTSVPDDWVGKDPDGKTAANPKQLTCLSCSSYTKLTTAWRKALRWTDGLDHALAVMLASIASVKILGDPLWIKVVSPAASGKSTLAEAVSVAKKYVTAKSTIRGFHSGFKEDGSEGEDNSLLSQLFDKTLIIKDGDTLLQSPNLSQILSEARDIYDGTSRTSYRNKMSKDYEGIRLTIILCGTSSLRALDSSELGERFLDCVIMDAIDDELEDEILWRVANRADRCMSIATNGDAESQYEAEMTAAMRLTGGYVNWLRENAAEVLGSINMPSAAKRQCTRFGKFVAHMRARPSLRQEEVAEREFASRLVSQLTRLAKCLALVLNRTTVDSTVMSRVRRIALDTSRGQTLSIVSHLYDCPEGLESSSISLLTGRSDDKTKPLLRFLRAIGAIELFNPESSGGLKRRPRWRLSPKMVKLYEDTMNIEKDD